MENPQQELPGVLHLLTSSKAAVVLHQTIKRYYTPDASIRHPLTVVKSGPTSRDKLLGVFEWYRVISPGTVATINEFDLQASDRSLLAQTIPVDSPMYHVTKKSLTQVARLITRVKLVEHNKLMYIKEQEDFFHPDDIMKYIFPPLAPVVTFFLRAVALGIWIASKIYLAFTMAWLAIFGISDDVKQGRMSEAMAGAQHAFTMNDDDERLKDVYYG